MQYDLILLTGDYPLIDFTLLGRYVNFIQVRCSDSMCDGISSGVAAAPQKRSSSRTRRRLAVAVGVLVGGGEGVAVVVVVVLCRFAPRTLLSRRLRSKHI